MTVITLCGGRQVIYVIAQSGNAIMATATGALYLKVVHAYRWFPDTGAMTVLADVGGTDMIQTLAGGDHAIVATATALGGYGMIKTCR